MGIEIMEKTSLERDIDKIKDLIKNADMTLLSYKDSDFDSKEAKTKLVELLNDGVKRENWVPFLQEFLHQLEWINVKMKKLEDGSKGEIKDVLLEDKEEDIETLSAKVLSKPNQPKRWKWNMETRLHYINYFNGIKELKNLDSKIEFSEKWWLKVHTETEGVLTFKPWLSNFDEIKDIPWIKLWKNVIITSTWRWKKTLRINKDAVKILKKHWKRIPTFEQLLACQKTVESCLCVPNDQTTKQDFQFWLWQNDMFNWFTKVSGLINKKIQNIDEKYKILITWDENPTFFSSLWRISFYDTQADAKWFYNFCLLED